MLASILMDRTSLERYHRQGLAILSNTAMQTRHDAPLDSPSWPPFAMGNIVVKPVSSAYSELCAALATEILLEHLVYDAGWPFETVLQPLTLHALTQVLNIYQNRR